MRRPAPIARESLGRTAPASARPDRRQNAADRCRRKEYRRRAEARQDTKRDREPVPKPARPAAVFWKSFRSASSRAPTPVVKINRNPDAGGQPVQRRPVRQRPFFFDWLEAMWQMTFSWRQQFLSPSPPKPGRRGFRRRATTAGFPGGKQMRQPRGFVPHFFSGATRWL